MTSGATSYRFDTPSQTCNALIGSGVSSILIALFYGSIHYFFHSKQTTTPIIYTKLIFYSSLMWSLITFGSSVAGSVGLEQTCSSFNTSGECSKIFSDGFFDKESLLLYKKNLSIVQVAIAFGWIGCFLFIFNAVIEFKRLKTGR